MVMTDKEEKEAASSESDEDDDDCSDAETEAPTAQNSSETLTRVTQLQSGKQTEGNGDMSKPAKPKVKKKKKKWLTVNLTNCKYECVRRTSKKFGFREVNEDEDFILYWTDSSVSLERVMDMKKYQKINHFPGMSEICRKDCLARNMNRLWKQFPKDYAIFPQTWCLPADYGDFLAFSRQKKNKTFIVKPDSGSQGRGIFLTKNPKQDVKPGEDVICQQYVSKPFLIDGFKFDLRIYAVVTSCDPLRIFIFKDGLVRFATVKYAEPLNSNVDNVFIHLTNYSINKSSEDFIRDEETGSKRRISTLNKWFVDNGYDVDKIWSRIDDIIIKTLITAHPILKHNYRTCFPNHNRGSGCFEILGFDVLLDKKLKPWVIEVNHSPSFTTDSRLDREIKDALVYDTLRLLNFSLCDRRKCIEEEKRRVRERLLQKPKSKEQKTELDAGNTVDLDALTRYEDKHIGNFRRIYPQNGCEEKYAMYFENSCSLFQETAASKARSECARIQREEIKHKTQEIEIMRKKNAGKKISVDGMRPESPRPRRKKFQNGYRFGQKREKQAISQKCFDSSKPMPIDEEDELERLGAMMQRDNLIRSLGVVEQVYRLLHGSCAVSKANDKSIIKLEKPKEEPKSKNLNLFHKQRPQSSTQSITIRSYLGRFLAHPSAQTAGLNPIITPAVTSDKVAPAISDPQTSSNKKVNILPFGINPSSLQRPKIGARKPPIPSRNTVEQEITTLTRGKELEVTRIGKQQKQSVQQQQQFPLSIESIDPIEARLSSSEVMSPPYGPILPCQAYSNLSRYSKDSALGLSIVSTSAPLQYKEEPGVKQHAGTVSTGALEVNGTCSKSTRAQRVRGASNSMRLRQMELVENRAMALS